MTTYMLMSSRNLTYSMDYDGLTCLRCHITFGGYYYFTDVRPYFISVVTDNFVLTLYLTISNILAHRVLSPMTISEYKSFSPIYIFFTFVMDSTSFLCTRPCPYFQHAPWLSSVPSVIYLYVSSPLLLHGTS